MANEIKTTKVTPELKSTMYKAGLVSSAAPLIIGILGLIICSAAALDSMVTVCAIVTVVGVIMLAFHFYTASVFCRTTVTVTDEGISGVCVSALFPVAAKSFSFKYSELETVAAPKPIGLIIRVAGKLYAVYTDEAKEVAALILEKKGA